jgi:hypothetical protein
MSVKHVNGVISVCALCAGEQRLGCVHRSADGGGHIADREIVEVAQRQHGAMSWCERC